MRRTIMALTAAATAVMMVGGASEGSHHKAVSVAANMPWTATGITLRHRQKVTISATGSIAYDLGKDSSPPQGFGFDAHKCGSDLYTTSPGTQITTRTSSAAAAAAAPQALRVGPASRTAKTVSVMAARTWTDTGLSLSSGLSVTVSATGVIHNRPDHTSGPQGFGFDFDRCGYALYRPGRKFVAPGLNCYSLLARIGKGPAFPIGKGYTFVVPNGVTGELYLGVNDNLFTDNSGRWRATITS